MNKPLLFCKQDLPYLTVVILLSGLLVLSPALNRIAFDEQRLFECLIVLLASLLVLFLQDIKSVLLNVSVHPRWLLLSVFALCLVSSILAKNSPYSFLWLALYLGLFFFSFFIAAMVKKVTEISRFFLFALLVAAFLYQINFFSGFLASFAENIPLIWPEPFSGFSNVRFFNQYQIWSILLLALPVLLYPCIKPRWKNTIVVIATGWAVLLFASDSRGAMLSVFLALFITGLIFQRHAFPFLKLNTVILAAGFVFYWGVFKVLPPLLENQVTHSWRHIDNLTNSNGRFELWRYAWQYIRDNPWLGIGPMHYAYYPGPTHAHPHNSVLQWASEMGIPSTLLLLYLVYAGLTAWVKKFYRLQADNALYVSPHLWIGLFASLCAGLIYSLFSGVIVMPLSQMMMALVIGWMLGLYFLDQKPKPASRLQYLSVQLLAVFTLVTLIYTVLPDVRVRYQSYSSLAQKNYPMIAPRFWQFGGIPH